MAEPLGSGEVRETVMQGGPDWTKHPPELLPLVYKALPDSSDFVRFRTVCRAWCAAAPESDPPPKLPWVLQRRGYTLQARQEYRFHSPSSGRTYGIRGRPDRFWVRASGSSHGYIVANMDLSTTALYNPLTGDCMALPAVVINQSST